MEPDDLVSFAAAMEKLKLQPTLVHTPELGFLRDFILLWGARLPAKPGPPEMEIDLMDSDEEGGVKAVPAAGPEAEAKAEGEAAKPVQSMDVADSDDEDADRLPEDAEPFPSLPPAGASDEPTEEQQNAAATAKQAAAEALEGGNVELAIEKYTEAILSGASSALLLAKRAELLLQQLRPRAAINDCNAALQANPDCGKAYRIRGIANRKLGRWEAAHADLSQGQTLDYDEATTAIQRLAAEKAKQIEERRAAASRPGAAKRRRVKK